MVETVSVRGKARAVATELATYIARVNHWGHGHTPSNQDLRALAADMQDTWEQAKLVESLLPKEDA